MIKYNDNIIILDTEISINELTKDEYFALMVTDHYFIDRPKKDFFCYSKKWVGLCCCSNTKVYISKDFNKRCDTARGSTVKVKVKDISKCYVL